MEISFVVGSQASEVDVFDEMDTVPASPIHLRRRKNEYETRTHLPYPLLNIQKNDGKNHHAKLMGKSTI